MPSNNRADEAYEQATALLLAHHPDEDFDHNHTSRFREAYEHVRSDLLDTYQDLDGPLIGDILGEAAAHVWPSAIDHI